MRKSLFVLLMIAGASLLGGCATSGDKDEAASANSAKASRADDVARDRRLEREDEERKRQAEERQRLPELQIPNPGGTLDSVNRQIGI